MLVVPLFKNYSADELMGVEMVMVMCVFIVGGYGVMLSE
jgi:hypothetical protein